MMSNHLQSHLPMLEKQKIFTKCNLSLLSGGLGYAYQLLDCSKSKHKSNPNSIAVSNEKSCYLPHYIQLAAFFGSHLRKEQYILDRRLVGHYHCKPIYANS